MKLNIRHFRFHHALILSVIAHLLFVLFSIVNAPDDIKKPDEFKYVKVKIGAMQYQSTINKHREVRKKSVKKQNPQKIKRKTTPKRKQVAQVVKSKTARKNKIFNPQFTLKPILKKPKPAVKPVKKQAAQPAKPKLRKGEDDKIAEKAQGAKGSIMGNREIAHQEVIDGYRQLIVLHLEKHQVYPKEAKRDKLTGTAKMRIKLRKDGKLLDYSLQESTSYPILDKAILKMIANSDPFPKFPKDYPDIEIDEFEIRANIVLKKQSPTSLADALFP